MRIAILTSGGDAPGMNATVLNLVKYAIKQNHIPFLVFKGFYGLVNDDMIEMNLESLNWDYLNQQGSFIYSSRYPDFKNKYTLAIDNLRNRQIDYVIVIGGNGSYLGAKLLADNGIKTVFIPSTIDNDVEFTERTIGFSSCEQEVVDNVLKLQKTFETHNNICFVEVMGRYCSDLTIAAGLVTHPTLCITHQNKLSIEDAVKTIYKKYADTAYAIVLVTEHLYDDFEKNSIMESLKLNCGCDVRWNILGYVQRGANPDWFDVYLAHKMSEVAINSINQDKQNVAIVYKNSNVMSLNFEELESLEKFSLKDLELINE